MSDIEYQSVGLSIALTKEDPERTPFLVEASCNPSTTETHVKEYFSSLKDMQARAEELSAQYVAVWMSEYGSYENSFGNMKPGWFIFWWTEKVGETSGYDNPPPGRGAGYTYDWSRPVKYKPYRK